MTAAKTIEQQRAEVALEAVRNVAGRANDVQRMYASYARSLPAMILMAGLGQALATAMSKGAGSASGGNAEAWRLLVGHLEDWLVRRCPASPYQGSGAPEGGGTTGLALMRALIDHDQRAYVIAQAEALAYLQWLKKFANALLAEPEKTAETADAPEAG